MAKNSTWSTAARNAATDAKAALLNSGYLRLYDGTQPAGPGTAISTQTLLAELRFNATAFGSAASGIATANSITSDSDADATGTLTWFRCFKSDGTTAVHDGSAGTSASNLIVATTSIVQHAIVDCSSFTITDAATSAL